MGCFFTNLTNLQSVAFDVFEGRFPLCFVMFCFDKASNFVSADPSVDHQFFHIILDRHFMMLNSITIVSNYIFKLGTVFISGHYKIQKC